MLKNAIHYKKETLKFTDNVYEKAYLNQEIAEILLSSQEQQNEAYLAYDESLRIWTDTYKSIKMKLKPSDTSFVTKMLNLKTA